MSKPGLCISNKVLLTRKNFISSFVRKGDSSVRVMDEHDIFSARDGDGEPSITYGCEKFAFLNLLGLYTHFAGTLGVTAFNEDNSPSCFQGSISRLKKDADDPLFQIWENKLGLGFHEIDNRNGHENHSINYRFSGNGGIYARLLHLLGYSTSVEPCKEQRNSRLVREAVLPKNLTYLIDSYDDFSGEGKRLAKSHLRDLVSVFFATRAKKSMGESYVRLTTIAQKNESLLINDAQHMVNAMNLAYNGAEFSLDNHFTINKDTCRERYSGYFKISNEDVLRVSTPENLFPIKLHVVVAPRYSFSIGCDPKVPGKKK